MKLLNPVLNDLTPRHVEIFWRYQVVRTAVDFGAASCFVVGSAFFFFVSMTRPADWLFLVGSILFAVKPTIDMVRSLHLRRLPAPGRDTQTPQPRDKNVLGAAPTRQRSLRRGHGR
ncbi:MAG: YrhK family protein [Solirubrobacteraceae bacterium]